MRTLGNKVSARNLATSAGVPTMPATPPLPTSVAECAQLARGIGYPVMLKASWGGGGRGMRVVESDEQLAEVLPVARREAKAAFGNDEVYLKKLDTKIMAGKAENAKTKLRLFPKAFAVASGSAKSPNTKRAPTSVKSRNRLMAFVRNRNSSSPGLCP